MRLASAELDRSRTGTVVRTALGALGAGLLLAGLVLIIAENWAAIPGFVKLGGWAVLQCAFLFLADRLAVRFPERLYLSEAFAFLAGGWVLAGIALVSQIYHLDSRPPNGVWLWLALALPAAAVLRRRATAVVLFAALTAALAMETWTDDSWLHARRAENPWLLLAIPMLGAALVSWLPVAADRLRGGVGAWVFGTAAVCLLSFGARQGFDETSLGGAWLLVAGGFLMALAWPHRCLPAAWDATTARAVLVVSVLPWILIGGQYDGGEMIDIIAVGTAWIAQLGIAILVIRAGARASSTAWVNLGYVALVAGIVTRYFDFFGDYLEGGTALTATGALLLFCVYALEKSRRRTLAGEVAA